MLCEYLAALLSIMFIIFLGKFNIFILLFIIHYYSLLFIIVYYSLLFIIINKNNK